MLNAEAVAAEPLESIKRTLTITAQGVQRLAEDAGDLDGLGGDLVRALELLQGRVGRVIVTGIGKSGHIARKIAATMSSTGTQAYYVHPTEASHGDLGMIGADDVLICLSWSGETPEFANILTYAKRFRVPVIALTSNPHSVLARSATVGIILPKVREACPHGLAPTTSTVLQLAVGDALALALLEQRGFSVSDFKVFHPGGKLGAQLTLVRELAHRGERMPLVPLGALMSDAVVTMSAKGFGVVGVVDAEGRLIGIVTDGDLRRHMQPDLLTTPVDRIMSARPRTVSGDVIATAALEILESQKITVLFVVDGGGRPVGIIHILDLLRAGVV